MRKLKTNIKKMENIDKKELTVMKGFVTKLENQALSIQITTKDEHKSAIDLVATLKMTGKRITEKKESITKPLNDVLKNVREMFKPIEDQYKSAENIIKGKLLDYTKKINEEARKKEEALAKRVEKGTMKIETAERKIEEVERVENSTKGDVGQVSIRKVRKVRFTKPNADECVTLLTMGLILINETEARKRALAGESIPCVEVYEEETLSANSL